MQILIWHTLLQKNQLIGWQGLFMLRITEIKSTKQAKTYFDEQLSKGEYYVQGNTTQGIWHGKLAEKLGLEGVVAKEDFHALCENLHPASGEPLTSRMKANRRVGYDFTFSVPKSVSIYYGITQDETILKAYREAIKATMAEIEADMRGRVRRDGADHDRITGNLLWAEFIHTTSRPVNGVEDPHLHTHAICFNLTHDPVEDRIKAGQFGELKRDARYYEAAFNTRFASKLKDLGFGIIPTIHSYELAGLQDRDLIQKFSNRTLQIEADAREKGISNDKVKANLGATTREAKRADISFMDLQQVWLERLSEDEYNTLGKIMSKSLLLKEKESITPNLSLEIAIAHLTERQSTMDYRKLAEQALRYGVGQVSPEEIEDALIAMLDSGTLIGEEVNQRVILTTPEILVQEQEMIHFAIDEGKGSCSPLHPNGGSYEYRFPHFHKEQQEAIQHVLSSENRVIALAGGAGTGKSTLAQEVKIGIEQGGYQVLGFSPTTGGTSVLQEEGFPEAQTIARLLVDSKMQNSLRNQVIFIDEAGLLGTKDMHALCKIAEDQNCRIILSGDIKQHSSVQRGDAMRILQHAGLETARVTEIFRQKPNPRYRDAVWHLARGDELVLNENKAQTAFFLGFLKLKEMDAIQEIEEESRYQQLASDYINTISEIIPTGKRKGQHRTALVVSPTHKEGRQVTNLIREGLKEKHYLAQDDWEITRLINSSLTEVQRMQARFYQAGMIIEFTQNSQEYKRGERLEILRIESDKVLLENGEELDLSLSSSFQLYHQERIPIAEKETIRITKNAKALNGVKMCNGSLQQVENIQQDGTILLSNGAIIDKNFGHLAHGYVTTSHGSQGKTVDAVFIAQSSDSFSASSMQQFYVSASRGRETIKIYTDDTEQLENSIQKSCERLSATELNQKIQQKRDAERDVEQLVDQRRNGKPFGSYLQPDNPTQGN